MAVVYPPAAPPRAFPKVELMMSTFPSRPGKNVSVPRPPAPKKPVAWHSSMKVSAPYLSASSQMSASGATLPSMEKTPSVTIRRVLAPDAEAN